VGVAVHVEVGMGVHVGVKTGVQVGVAISVGVHVGVAVGSSSSLPVLAEGVAVGGGTVLVGGVGDAAAVTTIRIGVGELAGGVVAVGAGVVVGGVVAVAVGATGDGVKVATNVRSAAGEACATVAGGSVTGKSVAPIT
jgi:hypothetical protein